jgi:hypothetical protein
MVLLAVAVNMVTLLDTSPLNIPENLIQNVFNATAKG